MRFISTQSITPPRPSFSNSFLVQPRKLMLWIFIHLRMHLVLQTKLPWSTVWTHGMDVYPCTNISDWRYCKLTDWPVTNFGNRQSSVVFTFEILYDSPRGELMAHKVNSQEMHFAKKSIWNICSKRIWHSGNAAETPQSMLYPCLAYDVSTDKLNKLYRALLQMEAFWSLRPKRVKHRKKNNHTTIDERFKPTP